MVLDEKHIELAVNIQSFEGYTEFRNYVSTKWDSGLIPSSEPPRDLLRNISNHITLKFTEHDFSQEIMNFLFSARDLIHSRFSDSHEKTMPVFVTLVVVDDILNL